MRLSSDFDSATGTSVAGVESDIVGMLLVGMRMRIDAMRVAAQYECRDDERE